MVKLRILVIEDDIKIRKMMVTTLRHHDYHVDEAENGQTGLQLMQANHPDLIILDLGLPDMDGVQVVETVRQDQAMPIIIVSARYSDQDKIRALDAGADDYLTKPFSLEELMARIRVMKRRQNYQVSHQSILKNGAILVNLETQIVKIAQQELHLTPNEYKLLVVMLANLDKVMTYNAIVKAVWGYYSDDLSALRVYMTTLRKKIETLDPDHIYIQTHVGVGYRMMKIIA